MAATLKDRLKTKLRGHQDVALRNCLAGFNEGFSRSQLTMPTGSGKTLLALNVAHRVAPDGTVLVIVPTIELLYQTAGKWHSEGHPGTYLGLCCQDPEPGTPLCDALTRIRHVEELVQRAAAGPGPVAVFCTYASLKKVEEAHRHHQLARWDLVIVDEAHRTAGSAEKDWARIHDESAIPARHRLYMTATPRVVDSIAAEGALANSLIASMDDPRLYGPEIYRLSLAEGIDLGLLADYELVAVEVGEEDVLEVLRNFEHFDTTGEGLRLAAAQVALLRAQHTYDLRRTLTFHTFIADAEVFAETLTETASYMPPDMRCTLSAGVVHSRLDPVERRQVMHNFIDTPRTGSTGEEVPHRAVLTNCRCFLEGVDIPSTDSILFADPKTSSIQIVQAIGRALRQTPGQGKVARIIVPVFLAPGQKMEEGVKGTRFDLLHQILISLSLWDEHVFHRVNFLRGDTTLRPFIPARPERADELIDLLDLRHTPAPNQVWDMAFEYAKTFYGRYGHLNVPSRYRTDEGFYLGWWIGCQRSLRKNKMLLPQRVEALDALAMLWEHPPRSIEYKLDIARDYAWKHGHLVPGRNERHAGAPLGRWLDQWCLEANQRDLPYCYQRELNEIYPWWNIRWDDTGEWRRSYAEALKAARKGGLPFPDLTPHEIEPEPTRWLGEQITQLFRLTRTQWDLLGALPISHPLAYLLRRPRGSAQHAFTQGLRAAYLFWRSHQHLNVPYDHVHREPAYTLYLGRWLAERRRESKVAQLRPEQIAALEALDMRWIPRPRRSVD